MWLVFYGRKEFGMTRAEVWSASLWEMQDMLAALAIYNGVAQQKRPKRQWTYDEVMALK